MGEDIQEIKRNDKSIEAQIERDLRQNIGQKSDTGFEINYDVAVSIVKLIEPEKLRETTKSFSINMVGKTSMLEARNADGTIEYTVHLPKDQTVSPEAPNYIETLENIIEERATYKKVKVGFYAVMSLSTAAVIVLVLVVRYLRGLLS